LVQNPKGGGLSGNIAGFSTQFMGVKQTTDVLEKGTWIFAAIIGVLCILSTLFIPGSRAPRAQTQTEQTQSAPAPAQNQTPGNTGTPAK
jgi:preprotein translocase subunit SecG